jgi:hypothetical protein
MAASTKSLPVENPNMVAIEAVAATASSQAVQTQA